MRSDITSVHYATLFHTYITLHSLNQWLVIQALTWNCGCLFRSTRCEQTVCLSRGLSLRSKIVASHPSWVGDPLLGRAPCARKRDIFQLSKMLAYLIFVIFFTRAKFLENKIFTKKTRILRQKTQKIANFLRYYGKIHSKLPIFCVKSVKIYTGQKKFTRIYS